MGNFESLRVAYVLHLYKPPGQFQASANIYRQQDAPVHFNVPLAQPKWGSA
jgi:hypothetical protein